MGASDVCINLKGVTHTSSLGLKGMICGWGGVDVAVSIAADRPPCSLSLEEPAPTWCHPSDLIGHHKQQPPPPQHGKPIQEQKRWAVLKIQADGETGQKERDVGVNYRAARIVK